MLEKAWSKKYILPLEWKVVRYVMALSSWGVSFPKQLLSLLGIHTLPTFVDSFYLSL